MLIINLSLVLLASAEINAYNCNAIRWGTDPFVIDIFKINFSKTTMGISKKTEILQTTENSEPTEILKANECARALAKNLAASNKLAVKGEALLKAIDKTDIPDKMLEEIKNITTMRLYMTTLLDRNALENDNPNHGKALNTCRNHLPNKIFL